MTNNIADDNTPYKRLVEQDEADVPNAASGGQNLFIDEADQLLKMKDSAGAVEAIGAPSGRVLISSETPTGTGTVSFASIPQIYSKLVIEYMARGTQTADTVSMSIIINGDSTGGNYRRQTITGYSATTIGGGAGDDRIVDDAVLAASGIADKASYGTIEIPFYASSTFHKMIEGLSRKRRDAGSVQMQVNVWGIDWENTAPITDVDLVLSLGDYASGSVINLYGVF